MFDPNAIASSQFVALVLALVILSLTITALTKLVWMVLSGQLVRAALVDALLLRLEKMTDAVERRNAIDQERMEWDRENSERRGTPRASRG